MRQVDGEQKVKALQKAFLCWVEEDEQLKTLDPRTFNLIRRQLFRATFEAFRLGVVGLGDRLEGPILWKRFFGWVDDLPALRTLPLTVSSEIRARCFRTSLEAFRIGALVTRDSYEV